MSKEKDRWYKILEPYIVSGPNSKGEYKLCCPIHNEKNASSHVNFDKGVFHCKVCGYGLSIRDLLRRMKQRETADDVGAASYDPFANNTIVDLDAARMRKGQKVPLTEAKILGFHEQLMGNPDLLKFLTDVRKLDMETIVRYQLGYDRGSNRYIMPVYDEDGNLVNARRYKRDADTSQKVWNWPGYGMPARLYPMDQFASETLLVVEGELDALCAISHGFAAVTNTHGSQTWERPWAKHFEGKIVYVSYDNDKEGRTGASKVVRSLRRTAREVFVVPPLCADPKSDISDYFAQGGTADALHRLLTTLEPVQVEAAEAEPEAVTVRVIGSMDSTTNGKPLAMNVTVTGKKDPTYSLPHDVYAECTMDAGPKCRACPMFLEHEGEYRFTMPEAGPEIARDMAPFIDASDVKVRDLLRQYIGTPKCNVLDIDIKTSTTVEELFVASSVDQRDSQGADYTQRRIYNFGIHDTEPNTTAQVIGTTWPNPKDSRNEFYSWNLQRASTSIDSFEVTPDIKAQLEQFQPAKGQAPIDKCREIAADMAQNVTHIYGRDRMHIAMDLVWHSVLQFPLDGKVLTRGWLEFIVVGDTRTGKSETAIRLADHYGLGHVIGCEGATFAGLVGAVKQVANEWTVQWGEITLNDRRLVVLDETSGLSQDIISQLSDIRSRGVAQLTKAEKQQTRARTRIIWVSNARKGRGVDEKLVDGVDIIEALIGNPEDIARFDFAMSVRTADVPMSVINNPDHATTHPQYSREACHNLILWAWSRKADDVVWDGTAYKLVYKAADWLGARYVPHPPLVQGTNVREKVARLAVALAARTYSTDRTGTKVIVKEEHVRDACNFLDRLYSYENFGYRRLSRRIQRNREIAKRKRNEIKKWLLAHPRLLEFLQDRRGSFRAQDLEEMAFMQRDEVNIVLSKLSDAKMISKDKSQIIMEPELQGLLKEIK